MYRYIGDGFPASLIAADLLDQWTGPQCFSQHVAGSSPGCVTFPSVGLERKVGSGVREEDL